MRIITNGTKPHNAPVRKMQHARGGYDEMQLEKISFNSLVKNYLCCSENSMCVLLGRCECLDVCRYGQRNLELKESQKGKGA